MTSLVAASKAPREMIATAGIFAHRWALGRISAVARPLFDAAAFLGAYRIAFAALPRTVPWFAHPAFAIAAGLICIVLAGAYDRRKRLFDRMAHEAVPASKGALAGAILFSAIAAFSGSPVFPITTLVMYPAAAATLVVSARAGLLFARCFWNSIGLISHRVLLAGAAERIRLMERDLRGPAGSAVRVVGVLPEEWSDLPGSPAALDARHLAERAVELAAAEVILCEPSLDVKDLVLLVKRLTAQGLSVRVVSSALSAALDHLPLRSERHRGLSVAAFAPGDLPPFRLGLMRAVDFAVSAVAIVLLAPLWAALAPLLYITQGRPVFLSQERLRKNGRRFKLYKFSTTAHPPAGPRITAIGKWLRRFRLDETLQFLNVLKGDIALVGARPPLPSDVERYEKWHLERLWGFVGVTGLPQIARSSRLSFDDVVLSDFFYNRNAHSLLALRIAWITLGAILLGRSAA